MSKISESAVSGLYHAAVGTVFSLCMAPLYAFAFGWASFLWYGLGAVCGGLIVFTIVFAFNLWSNE